MVVQLDNIDNSYNVRGATISNLTDNTPTLTRHFKGSTTTSRPAAYLCQISSLCQRCHRYCSEVSFINGVENVMADDASRLQHLTDSQFLHHFNSVYPQETPWTLCQSQPEMITSVTSSLQRRGNFKRMLRPPKNTLALHGAIGNTSALRSRSGPTLQGTQIPFKSSKSTSSNSANESTTRGARLPSKLIPFLNTSQPLSRKMASWWTRPKPPWDCGSQDKSNTSPSVTSCVPSPKQILLPTEYGPSTPPSSSNSWQCHDPKSSQRSTGLRSANLPPWASTTSTFCGPASMPNPAATLRTMTL